MGSYIHCILSTLQFLIITINFKNIPYQCMSTCRYASWACSVCVCVCVCSVALVVFNSAIPSTIARVLCPWDFPGKNTRLSCHSSSRGSPQPRDHLSYPKTLSRGPTGTGTVLEMQVLLAVTLLGAVALCYGLSGPHLGKVVGVKDWHVGVRLREMRAFFSCMAWRGIPSPLSKHHRRLDSL